MRRQISCEFFQFAGSQRRDQLIPLYQYTVVLLNFLFYIGIFIAAFIAATAENLFLYNFHKQLPNNNIKNLAHQLACFSLPIPQTRALYFRKKTNENTENYFQKNIIVSLELLRLIVAGHSLLLHPVFNVLFDLKALFAI